MGNPTEGTAGTGAKAAGIAPVILGGLDTDGLIRTIQVDADGVIQTSASVTPTLAAVVAVGNSANSHKLTNVTDPTAAQDAATMHYVLGRFTALLAALPTSNPGPGSLWNNLGVLTNGT